MLFAVGSSTFTRRGVLARAGAGAAVLVGGSAVGALAPAARAAVPDGDLAYVGNYRQGLFNARVDQKISPRQTLMMRTSFDRFYDTNPNDAVGGTSAPNVARRYTRGAVTGQANLTTIVSSHIVNEARFAYLDGDPVTRWEAQTLSTAYTRAGSVPFTIGQSRLTDTFSRQPQLSDTLSWSRGNQTIRLGGSVARHS